RQAEALAAFREGRRALVDELGIEPGPDLRALHEAILTGDPVVTGEPAAPAAPAEELAAPVEEPATAAAAPCELPRDVSEFVGRTGDVEEIRRLLLTPRPVVVTGKPGVGKTSLAVHVTHLLTQDAAEFPDGQLYADLRGARPDQAEPGEVLAHFLRAFGVHGARIPDTLDERVALYRSLLATRRVLVVLDDAADERQVRPLLPGAGQCAVLVT